MARRLLNVIDTNLLDSEEGSGGPALSYTWTDMGQDATIAAETTSLARTINRLVKFDNSIFLGYGDIGAAVRPLMPRYWDIAGASFNTITGHASGWETDGLSTHFLYDNKLWFPFNDPTNVTDYANATSRTSATTYAKVQPDSEHIFDMCTHTDGYLYACGAVNSLTNEATVWRSTDGGAVWAVVYQPQITNMHWFTCIFSYGGYLWTQGHTAGNGIGNLKRSSDGTTWSDSGIQWSSPMGGLGKAIPLGAEMLLVGIPVFASAGKCGTFDGTATMTDITDLLSDELIFGSPVIRDAFGFNDTVYAVGGNQIRSTADGATATLLTTCPTASSVRSLLVDLDGTIWCGTNDSHLWRGVPSVEPTRSGTYYVDASGNYLIDHKGDFLVQ